MKELIIGIDPGSRNTGYGVIEVCTQSDKLKHVAHGVIKLNEAHAIHQRLPVLHAELTQLFAHFSPSSVVIEKIFFGKSADSAFKLGHARGVALLAAVQAGATVHEYAARLVKKVIAGSGAASKDQVQMMIFQALRVRPVELAFDASDALSLAVCHMQMRDVADRLRRMKESEL